MEANAALKALAGEVEGFGRDARGGAHGRVYVVTSLEDDGLCEGTLRHGCAQKEPLWIVFAKSGTIRLSEPLAVSSHKTVDGRGQQVTISREHKRVSPGLNIEECEHVIICNLVIHHAGCIQIKTGSKHIGVGRCTLIYHSDAGSIGISGGSTDITVSRCRFVNNKSAVVIGGNPCHVDDRGIRVTIHHCFFENNCRDQPSVMFGKTHLYNNYTRVWQSWAICAGVESQIVSQSCIYEAGRAEFQKQDAFAYDLEKAGQPSGSLRSEEDVFLYPTQVELRRAEGVFDPKDCYPHWTLESADDALAKSVRANAGWQEIGLPPYAI